jgi:hypothetical protein
MAKISGIQPSSGMSKGDQIGNRTYDQSTFFVEVSKSKSEDVQSKIASLIGFLV